MILSELQEGEFCQEGKDSNDWRKVGSMLARFGNGGNGPAMRALWETTGIILLTNTCLTPVR